MSPVKRACSQAQCLHQFKQLELTAWSLSCSHRDRWGTAAFFHRLHGGEGAYLCRGLLRGRKRRLETCLHCWCFTQASSSFRWVLFAFLSLYLKCLRQNREGFGKEP